MSAIRFHDLQHSTLTLHCGLGEHSNIVADILGPLQVTKTLDTYSHVLPNMHNQAAPKLDQLLRVG